MTIARGTQVVPAMPLGRGVSVRLSLLTTCGDKVRG